MKENQISLNADNDLLDYFQNNIPFSKRNPFLDLERKYPKLNNFFEEFLKSERFKKMINAIKIKHDEEFLKLFFRHTKNFLNLFKKNSPFRKFNRKLGSKQSNSNIKILKNDSN